MRWVVLVVSGMLEAVWAHALAGDVRQVAVLGALLVGLGGSVGGLWFAMREIPMGTAYAVWSGVGATTTAGWAALSGEPFGPGTVVCVIAIVTGVVGLQLSEAGSPRAPRKSSSSPQEL